MNFQILKNPRFINTPFAYGEQREINFNTNEPEVCDGCGRFIGSLKWASPYNVKISKKKIGDLIFGSFVGFLVSENFKRKFEKTDMKGLFNFREVNLFYKKSLVEIDKYYYPEISLISAFVDLDLIEFEKKDSCDICQIGKSIINKVNGIDLLNPENIKQDIFYSSTLGQADIIVSEKFKDFVEVHEFTNAKFFETKDYV